ncbi:MULTISPECIES: YkvA family protein [unclassified Streptomyces]|uniref:YkvA family protein n=1 Tax=Streptomycetaceae TaxID=2062 RepID=UPI002E7804C0|nr:MULTISPECIES: YkvA family protein [unclassified Streptomyces]MED7949728.1 YkvA family protein [Streptomyces sp. BE303]MEE1823977.1 YkvA family protein [Streptomyces sp. BE20]
MDGNGVFWVVGAGVVLATLVVAGVLVVKLVRARKLLGASGIPMSKKVLFWASIAYLVSPVDLLPDPILLDDIGFLLVALRSLGKAGLRAGVGSAGPGVGGTEVPRLKQ